MNYDHNLWGRRASQITSIIEQARADRPDLWAAGPASSRDLGFITFAVQLLRLVGIPAGLNGKRGSDHDISHDVFALPNPTGCNDTSGRHPGLTLVDFVGNSETPAARVIYNDTTINDTGGFVGETPPGAFYTSGRYIDPPGSVAPPGPSQPPPPAPGWELRHSSLLGRFNVFSPPGGGGSDRMWLQQLAEQFAFSFPGEGWGLKSASPDRPVSGNVFARKTNGTFTGYQVVPVPVGPPPSFNLTGQHFISVTPTNHLGEPTTEPIPGPAPEPTPQPTPTPPPVDPGVVGAILAALADIDRRLTALEAAAATPPSYTGVVFGSVVLLKPTK
jgi:hypothetical protein